MESPILVFVAKLAWHEIEVDSFQDCLLDIAVIVADKKNETLTAANSIIDDIQVMMEAEK